MKKLLLIAAALTTMVSCSKTQVIPEETQQQEIAMKAFNQTAVKATGPISGPWLSEDYNDELMKVYGFYSSDESTYAPYFTADYKYQTVNSVTAWMGWDGTAHKPYYWPLTGKMKVIAVFPTGNGTISCTYTSTTGSETIPTITRINNVNLETEQDDIMYSSNLYSTPVVCPPADAQELSFQHLLSQVVVAVKPSVAGKIKVDEVKWLGAYTKSDIVVKETFEATDYDTSVEYTYTDADESRADITYTLSTTLNSVLTGNDEFVKVSDNGALVLPVKTGYAKPQLSITYTFVTDSSDPSKNITVTRTVGIGEEWAAGKKYVYNVTINSLNEITFTAKVADWVTPTSVTPSI